MLLTIRAKNFTFIPYLLNLIMETNKALISLKNPEFQDLLSIVADFGRVLDSANHEALYRYLLDLRNDGLDPAEMAEALELYLLEHCREKFLLVLGQRAHHKNSPFVRLVEFLARAKRERITFNAEEPDSATYAIQGQVDDAVRDVIDTADGYVPSRQSMPTLTDPRELEEDVPSSDRVTELPPEPDLSRQGRK